MTGALPEPAYEMWQRYFPADTMRLGRRIAAEYSIPITDYFFRFLVFVF
jgi:hypothetical protein